MSLFHLPPIPEFGIGRNVVHLSIVESSTICDRCMKKSSRVYYLCGIHKMCSDCASHFRSTCECPLCKNHDIRILEKITGRCHATMNTYFPGQDDVASHKESNYFLPQSMPFPITDEDSVLSLDGMSGVAEDEPMFSLHSVSSVAEDESMFSLHASSSIAMDDAPSMLKPSCSTTEMLSPPRFHRLLVNSF